MKNFITDKRLKKLKNSLLRLKYDLIHFIPSTYLCWKYPFLKSWSSRNKFFQKWCYYDCIPDGWRKAFGKQLLKEMKHAALKYATKEEYKNMYIDDIKEKWGSLDINGSFPTAVWKVLHKYEYISMHTCIDCGEMATVRSTGWICPYCDEHVGNRTSLHFGHQSGPDWYGWRGNIDDIPDKDWKNEEKLLNKYDSWPSDKGSDD